MLRKITMRSDTVRQRSRWSVHNVLAGALASVALSAFSTPVLAQAQVSMAGAVAPAALWPTQARVSTGRPRTLWDERDVAAYKASIAPGGPLAAAFTKLKAWGDQRIAGPLDVPAHKLEADGTWSFPDFMRGYKDSGGKWNWEWKFNGTLQARGQDVAKLGMLYALTGDKRYAAYARTLMLALVDAYGNGLGAKPGPEGYDHFAAYGFDGGDAGLLLTKLAQGYDLVFDTMSAKDRTRVERDLMRPLVEGLKKNDFMYRTHDHWGMVCLYGLFIAGETLGDQSYIDLALYGPGGSSAKSAGGFMDCFQAGCMREGAIWGAGDKPEDQMAAAAVMTNVAEVMWHRGVDLYAYADRALKKPFDGALALIAKDGAALGPETGIDAFRYAYAHYRDARYAAVADKLEPDFTLEIGVHLPTPPIR